MAWYNRIVVLTVILCLSRVPIPWAHSHVGMNAEQLVSHLNQYHAGATENELPTEWHWHVLRFDLITEYEIDHSLVAVPQFCEEQLSDQNSVSTMDVLNEDLRSRVLRTEDRLRHATRQQKSYLRLKVLLI